MEIKILITLGLLALMICMPGCGFLGVEHARLWKDGPEWWNKTNQKWSISTEEIPSTVAKQLITRGR